MAERSKQVTTLLTWIDWTAGTAEVQGPEVAGLLAAQHPKRDYFKEAAIRARHEAIVEEMRLAGRALDEAEGAYVEEQGDEPPQRAERDRAGAQTAASIGTLRAITQAVPAETARDLGLGAPYPDAIADQIAYAQNVVDQLNGAAPVTTSEGDPIDLAPLASTLAARLDRLVEAHQKLDDERREVKLALDRRDRALTRARHVYLWGATQLAADFDLAARHKLADYLRPTVRRSTGQDEELPPDQDTPTA